MSDPVRSAFWDTVYRELGGEEGADAVLDSRARRAITSGLDAVLATARPGQHVDDAMDEQVLKERDDAEEWADRLAHGIGEAAGVKIGEHSSMNDPWRNALEAVQDLAPARSDGGRPGSGAGIAEHVAALSRIFTELRYSLPRAETLTRVAHQNIARVAELTEILGRVRALTVSTDGDDIDPDAEIPVGEVRRALDAPFPDAPAREVG